MGREERGERADTDKIFMDIAGIIRRGREERKEGGGRKKKSFLACHFFQPLQHIPSFLPEKKEEQRGGKGGGEEKKERSSYRSRSVSPLQISIHSPRDWLERGKKGGERRGEKEREREPSSACRCSLLSAHSLISLG